MYIIYNLKENYNEHCTRNVTDLVSVKATDHLQSRTLNFFHTTTVPVREGKRYTVKRFCTLLLFSN